jgi:hypothetical protein
VPAAGGQALPRFGAMNISKRVTLLRWERRNGERCYVSVPAQVDLFIDVDGIIQELGAKALGNKSKQSRTLHGRLIAKVKRLREKQEDQS